MSIYPTIRDGLACSCSCIDKGIVSKSTVVSMVMLYIYDVFSGVSFESFLGLYYCLAGEIVSRVHISVPGEMIHKHHGCT
eukprot:13271397-Ditylum_brightwellii.AAC.1